MTKLLTLEELKSAFKGYLGTYQQSRHAGGWNEPGKRKRYKDKCRERYRKRIK
ncbi:hypothetical protein G7K71_08480 [Desulfofundulus sp. TPOSR]|uniref:hypothetical protein n=1 Tax=Desulfofundulus sp. TPOSR TaxID=2714340 RepID=UPI001409EC6F|nr:hypothetical protein [Desulfofundulus sp. TPOSR]NHM25430.1 hypothetical protein [Desulfofundulus sp. TPOSR]NHM27019.1 hypothetical protein [Desulfofundulus sp. TPOSR]